MLTLTFEGFVDLESGWEFDAPLYVLAPVKVADHPVSNGGGVDAYVEDYMIDLACGLTPYSDQSDRHDWDVIERFFINAKVGRPHRGIRYWRRTVEYDEVELRDCDAAEPFRVVGRAGWGA